MVMHSSSEHLVTPSSSSPSSASKRNHLTRANVLLIKPSNSHRSESNLLHSESISSQTKFVITPETVIRLNRHQSTQQKRPRIQWTQRYASFHSSSSIQTNSMTDFKAASIIDHSTKMHPSISITDMTAKDFDNEYQGEPNQPVRCISIPMVSSDEDDELDDDEIDQIINQHDAVDMGQEIAASIKAVVEEGKQVILTESKSKKKPKSSHVKKPKSSVKQASPSSAISAANRTSPSSDPTTSMKVPTKNDDSSGSKSIITVDTSKARSNLEVVRLCLHELGWKECSSNTNAESDIYWHSSSFHEGNATFPFNSGRVNKFPGMTDLLRKIHLTRSLNNMRLLFPHEYDFYPKTWFLPEQNQQFKDDVRYLHQLDKKHNRQLTTFIVKPSDGSQGEGIYLLRDPSHIISSNRPHVIQEYIDRPLLINGLKFDLRIYVLILNLYPLEIFLYEEGLVRFATVNYKAPSTDNLHQTYMHLTNYSLNKRSANYKHTVDDQQIDGSKRKLTLVWKQLSQLFGNEKVERSKSLIIEMINKTVLAILPELRVEYEFELPLGKKQDVSCFQIIGFDIILNEHLKPILLEVNSNPSLRIDFDKENENGKLIYQPSLIDKEIKKPLILETLKLALPKKKLNTITRHAQIQAYDEIMAQRLEKVAQRRVEERNEKMKSARKTRFDMKLNPFFSRPLESIAHEFIRQQQEQQQQQYEQQKSHGSSPTHPIIIGRANEEITAYTLNNNSPSPQPTNSSHLMKKVNRKPKKERYLPHQDDNESGPPKASVIEVLPSAGTKRSFVKAGSTRPSTTTDAAMIKSIETLKLIFPTDNTTKYRPLFIVDKIAYIYIQLVTMVGYKSMTSGQFRNFANICGIINETITAPSIDILYYQMLRKWQQFVLRAASTGLPFAAFIEAFFLLSQRKFPNAPNLLDSVVCLVTICIRHMNLPLQNSTSPVLHQTSSHLLHRTTTRTSSSTLSSSWNIRANLSALRSPITTSVHRSSFLTSSASLSKAHSQQSSSLSQRTDDKTQQSSPRHSAKSVFPLFFDVL